MRYRILLLAALFCAILTAAVGGTLAGYTTETSYSISIEPAATSTPKPHKPVKTAEDVQAGPNAAQEDIQTEPEASPVIADSDTVETGTTADDVPLQTSDKEA